MTQQPLKSRYPEGKPLEDDIGSWWVMHTKPNCEAGLANYLERREISYYLPLVRKKKIFGGLRRTRTILAPLFTGYLCFALERDQHSLLYDTKKFVRIIKVDDQERFVKELSAIAKAIETQGENFSVQQGIPVGRRVAILTGPLAGHEGLVVRRNRQEKLALSVHMFNQSVVVNLDPATELEPI
ncbi:MAG: transcription termination/antitermination NusG family protein [Thermodesulfobacteriota bacterium]